jgi:hypothetical protein
MAKTTKKDNSFSLEQQLCSEIWQLPDNSPTVSNILAKYDNGSIDGMDACIQSGSCDDIIELLRALDPQQKKAFIDKILTSSIEKTLLASKSLELLEASGGNHLIIYGLFRLPPETLTSILTEPEKLLNAGNHDAKNTFIWNLFQLSPEVLLPILKNNLMKMLHAADKMQYSLVNRLLQLPDASLKLICNEDTLCKLPYYIDFPTWQALCKKIDIPLTKIDLQGLNFQKHTSLIFLKITAPLIESLSGGEISQLNPVIKSLLSKTYFQASDSVKRNSFANKLSEGLNELIKTETILARIIENAATTEGDVFITTNCAMISGSTMLTGQYIAFNIFAAMGSRKISAVLNTITHEATHKLIDQKFSNKLLPYTKDDHSFEVISPEIAKELSTSQDFKSWLKHMTQSYTTEKFAVEILPHFTGNMAQSILEQKNTKGVSEAFGNLVWGYLNKQLFDNIDYKPLPQLYYHHSKEADHLELMGGNIELD